MLYKMKITSDFFLIIIALFMASVIWLIAKAGDLATENVSPIVIEAVNVPDNLDIQIPNEGAVIEVQYPKAQKRYILPSKFKIVLDFKSENIEAGAGIEQAKPIQYPISSHNIQIAKDMPPGIKVLGVRDPRNIWIQAQVMTVPAKIKAITVGQPAEGYEFKRALLEEKEHVLLTASRKIIELAQKDAEGRIEVETEPIDISGKNENFIKKTKLIIPETFKYVMNEPDSINVNIVIEEKTAKKVIEKVPVKIYAFSENLVAKCNPAEINVVIEGPLSHLQKIGRASFVFNTKQAVEEAVGFAGKYAIEAKFSDQVDRLIKEKTTIINLQPADVEIEFKAKTLDIVP